jgi:hypothetical protein
MSVDAKAEILIEKPRDDVAEVMFDPKNDTLWIGGLTNVFPQQSGLMQKGAKFERVGSFQNRAFSSIYLVTRDEPGQSVEISADEPFQMKIRYDLADADGGTMARIRIQSIGENEYQLPSSLLDKAVRDAITADLKRLKDRVESGNV